MRSRIGERADGGLRIGRPSGTGTSARTYPDGLGIWAEENRDIAFLLEYDTGTEHLPQLTGYAEKARMPGGLVSRMPVLFCFPTPRREQTARKALAATTASLDLQIATAALDPPHHLPGLRDDLDAAARTPPPDAAHRPERRTTRPLAHRTRATRTRTPRVGPGAPMTLHAALGEPADGSPGIPHSPDGTSRATPLTPQVPGEAAQPSHEPDPPGQKAGDPCPSQEPEPVSQEQGLRAWAAALAAELPPLTSSQAAAVARIAARLDARNGQEPVA
jgi:hypothetical protein